MAVRLEKVILDLDDRFSGPATRAAASAALLRRSVDDLGTASEDTDHSLTDTSRSIDDTGSSARRANSDIDRYSGRLRLIADAVAILGPGLVPIGAVGIPAVAGLAAEMGAAGIGAGAMALAFQGVGDAITKVNKAAIDPTDTNLKNARLAMSQLGEDAQDFVRAVQDARPAFESLRDATAAGVFPGVTDALGTLVDDLFPRLETVMGSVGDRMGSLAVEAADALTGPQWTEFIDFVGENVPSALGELGHTIGNVVTGLAELWMAFDPLNDDFSGWLLDVSESFERWATNLSQTQGFEDFVAYIRETGPQVADTMAALAQAILDIVEAAAPIGGPVLQSVEALARAISAIADSDMGTPILAAVAAMSAFNRVAGVMEKVGGTALMTNVRNAETLAGKMEAARGAMMRAGASAAYLGLSLTDVDDKAGVSNTAMGALLGTMIAPGWGTAIGAIAGGGLDIKAAMDDAAASTENLMDAIAHGTRGEISSGIDQVRTDLNALREDQSNFMDIGPAAGQGLGDKLASDFNAIVGNSGAMTNALHAGEDAMHSSNDAADMLAGTVGRTAGQLDRARVAADVLSSSLTVLNGFFSERDAMRNYEESLDALWAGLRKNSKAWNADTEAGRANLDMLDANATSILQMADQISNPRARRSFLMDARQDLVKLRNAFPGASHAIGQVIDRLTEGLDGFEKPRKAVLDVDAKKATDKTIAAFGHLMDFGKARPKAKLDADDKPARDKINSTDHLLQILSGKKATPGINVTSNSAAVAAQTNADLDRIQDETVWITTRRANAGGMGAVGGADGMTVPGYRQPYGDKVFAHLAPGEEVISNRHGQADRHRELLKAINANAYADGGTVGARWHSAPSAGHTTRIIERLPDTIVLDAGELGEIVIDTTDARIGDYREHDARNAATSWQGVTSD